MEKFQAFVNNRWLVFVDAMWIQYCAGIGQLSKLGVAKYLGDSVGFLAGSLSEILPLWGTLLVGALQNLIGYGWVWLTVTGRAPVLPLWAMCILIFVGNNGETYFNTAALVSSVQNFPESKGPVVGILKGFAGLSGAILTQIYTMINFPDQASLIFMVVVGPAMVVVALIFIVRPVGGHRQVRPSDGLSFSFIYRACLLLAAYLMGVMLLKDLVSVSHTLVIIFTVILFFLLIIPIVLPIILSISDEPIGPVEEVLLPKPEQQEASKSEQGVQEQEVMYSEVNMRSLRTQEVDLLPASERQKRIAQLQA
ncbi:hypothetical protein F3Y22_tig00013040pilonHSYRG00171 [Hibiscus syriacus]|uniref:Nodulin-like domain-containing protein n=1 Tax=Hibiscus syriacus TaxID=106335 RepID=A0A6A3C6E0_HIBSY|nr:hypothetical protein F3Y22_tig00013040pilonHSYRG00171 [Hibiscus syriacus]